MVRHVLDSSKVVIDKSLAIHPFKIQWSPNSEGLLRINEPFYLNTNAQLIQMDLDKLPWDEGVQKLLNLSADKENSLYDIPPPYTIWKHENSDTIYIMKSKLVLEFIMLPTPSNQ